MILLRNEFDAFLTCFYATFGETTVPNGRCEPASEAVRSNRGSTVFLEGGIGKYYFKQLSLNISRASETSVVNDMIALSTSCGSPDFRAAINGLINS